MDKTTIFLRKGKKNVFGKKAAKTTETGIQVRDFFGKGVRLGDPLGKTTPREGEMVGRAGIEPATY